ncbi:MAG: DUF4338 domain-containing protein [Sterolibacteriaceae bacterium]|nr:DUF4338 domain-containing protein [Sterolibacteriaceae bacterium]
MERGTRAARLALIVGNSRFLIVPSVQVKNLASHVLGLASRQLAGDWQRHYGYKPVLIEVLWIAAATGRLLPGGQLDRSGDDPGAGPSGSGAPGQVGRKQVFVYPLQRNWRKLLTAPPELARLMPSVQPSPG